MTRTNTAVTGGRERTWAEVRIDWERKMRQEIADERKRANLPPARDRHTYKANPWDNVELGERCEYSDLHKVSCGHCTMPEIYFSNEFPRAEEAA